ncbi:hypothetical protein FQZ97_559230 [compost metagenome]
MRRAANQHDAGAAFASMGDQRPGHVAAAQLHHVTTEAFSQLLGALQVQARLFIQSAASIHMHQRPRQVPPFGHPAGVAHQPLGIARAIHADQQAPAHGRRLAALLAIAMREVGIHSCGGGLHRQFAQGGEVGLAEEGIDGGAGLLRNVHLAFAQALQQLARRQVDQEDFVGILQHPVRHRFAHLHAGDVAHLVVEAFQVLDVDRGVDVDAGIQQFLDVLPALGVAAAGGVAVGQLVDQRQLRRIGEQAVEVQLGELDAAVLGAQRWLLRQSGEQRLGLGAAVGLDDPRAQLHTLTQLAVRRLQHGEGLAHARRGAEEYLEATPAHPWQVGKQGIGAPGIAHDSLLGDRRQSSAGLPAPGSAPAR